MNAQMIDSRIFGHQWSTPESHAIFSEAKRVGRWLDVIIALAEAQAECGIIPQQAAKDIASLSGTDLSIEDIAARTRATAHSTLGMIQILRELLPADTAQYVYYGATVQDITDTSQILELGAVGSLLWRDFRSLEATLLETAVRHRETPMAGRTHGQLGSPITFGFKVASWADEIGRHLERMRDARARWLVGQLGGAVGNLAFFGDSGLALRAAFCRRLSLSEPNISWLSARDRIVEFAQFVALSTTSIARIANEIYALQRPEIGELRERSTASTVGSITMPHKRNPEGSEQIVALAQLVRAQAAILADAMVHEHERDGRNWKVEWAVFPILAHAALAATSMSAELLSGLEVDAAAMARNLALVSGSEHLLSAMSRRVGKHKAQELLQEAYRRSREALLPAENLLKEFATQEELTELSRIDLGMTAAMIDRVVAAAGDRRSSESPSWR